MADVDRFDGLLRDVRELPAREAAPEVARFFAELGPGEAEALAAARPDDVGELDGAPWRLRVATNDLRLRQARQTLRDRYAAGRITDDERTRLTTLNRMLMPNIGIERGPDGSRVVVDVPRQFLSLRTDGDGSVIEVSGDLSTASQVALSVHGMGVTLDGLSIQTDIARAIHTEAGPGTATVNFVYDGPNGLPGAMSKKAAYRAAESLAGCVAGLHTQIRADAHTTAFAHSYGTVVTAEAVRDGRMHLDNVIFAGSPGLGHDLNSVADLNADPGTRFFAMRAPLDVVSYGQWHGRDPADFPDIVRLDTAGGDSVSWHEQYWRPNSESLRNVGRVTRGDYGSLTTTATTPGQETRLALGVSWGGAARSMSAPVGRMFGKAFDGTAAAGSGRPAAASATVPDHQRRPTSGRTNTTPARRAEGPEAKGPQL